METPIEIMEEAVSLKKAYEVEANRESSWNLKHERMFADKYSAFLKEHNLTDKDVSKFMYPSSYA